MILGSATVGEAASAGRPRTSGVAALMAGAPRGRVPDACGAIVTALLAQDWPRRRHPPRITHRRSRHAAPRANNPRERSRVVRSTQVDRAHYGGVSIATPRLRSPPPKCPDTEDRADQKFTRPA